MGTYMHQDDRPESSTLLPCTIEDKNNEITNPDNNISNISGQQNYSTIVTMDANDDKNLKSKSGMLLTLSFVLSSLTMC